MPKMSKFDHVKMPIRGPVVLSAVVFYCKVQVSVVHSHRV